MASSIKIHIFHFLAEPSTSFTRETLLDIKMRYSGTIAAVLLSLAATSVVAAPQPNPEAAAPTPVTRSEVTKTLDKRTVYSGYCVPAENACYYFNLDGTRRGVCTCRTDHTVSKPSHTSWIALIRRLKQFAVRSERRYLLLRRFKPGVHMPEWCIEQGHHSG
ncbi:hypothetical protein BJ166DRAFT_520624 [Pestalotiopsis sp. NC0098]|nr:hypothetical protein BJ166DRAFT_520624 [Pestalotiopsis sp. NC0098]